MPPMAAPMPPPAPPLVPAVPARSHSMTGAEAVAICARSSEASMRRRMPRLRRAEALERPGRKAKVIEPTACTPVEAEETVICTLHAEWHAGDTHLISSRLGTETEAAAMPPKCTIDS